MITRKIQQTNRNSFLLTIPKLYCDLLGIEKGAIVGIEYLKNKLIVMPVTPSAKNKSQTAQHPAISEGEGNE